MLSERIIMYAKRNLMLNFYVFDLFDESDITLSLQIVDLLLNESTCCLLYTSDAADD